MFVARQLTVDGCLLLGDCWFVAAAALLACRPALFHEVVPADQQFDKDYAGLVSLSGNFLLSVNERSYFAITQRARSCFAALSFFLSFFFLFAARSPWSLGRSPQNSST